MSLYPPDVRYACARLGLAEAATPDEAWEVVANARAYRFVTRDRIAEVERFAAFLSERTQLGAAKDSFATIRKAYHRKAMALHPDRNRDNPNAEEELKAVNAAYEMIEDIHSEAREYYTHSAETRRAMEIEARKTTEREASAAGEKPSARTVHMSYDEAFGEAKTETRKKPHTAPQTGARPRGTVKYVAAWVPRYIRNSRLFYLGRDAVIGSKLVKSEGSIGLLYDVIMLTEREFVRAKLQLGMEGSSGSPALEMSRLTPAYIPMDTKKILVPPGETNPHEYARLHFLKEFKLVS